MVVCVCVLVGVCDAVGVSDSLELEEEDADELLEELDELLALGECDSVMLPVGVAVVVRDAVGVGVGIAVPLKEPVPEPVPELAADGDNDCTPLAEAVDSAVPLLLGGDVPVVLGVETIMGVDVWVGVLVLVVVVVVVVLLLLLLLLLAPPGGVITLSIRVTAP